MANRATASWIGKAAYEITQITKRSGADAHAIADQLASGLMDYGFDLAGTDPRNYAREHFGIAPLPVVAKQALAPKDPAKPSARRDRKPTSKSSWIGMAAHEIDEHTPGGPATAAELARNLAHWVVHNGHALLATDPRHCARLHFGPEAMAEKKRTHDALMAGLRREAKMMSDYLERDDEVAIAA